MIDPIKVRQVATACFSEDGPESIKAPGIMVDYLFDKKRLEFHREEIKTWLEQLPVEFRAVSQGGGGGWSFLNFCMTKDEELWTGEHSTCELLLCLGEALGYITFSLPRDVWSALPGGVPYLMVTL